MRRACERLCAICVLAVRTSGALASVPAPAAQLASQQPGRRSQEAQAPHPRHRQEPGTRPAVALRLHGPRTIISASLTPHCRGPFSIPPPPLPMPMPLQTGSPPHPGPSPRFDATAPCKARC